MEGVPLNLLVPNSKLQFSKIVSISTDGHLNVEQENLQVILDSIKSEGSMLAENTPVNIVAISGPNDKERKLLANLLAESLLNYSKNGMECVGKGVVTVTAIPNSPISEISDSSETFQPNRIVSMARTLFRIQNELERSEVVVGIIEIPCIQHDESSYELEEFLAMICSKILKLEWVENDKIQLKILEPYLAFSPMKDTFLSPVRLEKICNTSTHTLRYARHTTLPLNILRTTTPKTDTDTSHLIRLLEKVIKSTEIKKILINQVERTFTFGNMFELITAAATVARNHCEDRENARAELEALVRTATVQITTVFPSAVKNWIENHLTVTTDTDEKIIQSCVVDEVLERLKGSVHQSLLKEFHNRLVSFYNTSCHPMWVDFENFVVTLNAALQQQLGKNSYIPAEKLDKTLQDACRDSNIRAGDFISDFKKLASEKLGALYKEENDKFLEGAKKRFAQETVKLGQVYKEEVALYLNQNPYDILAVEVLHYNLLAKIHQDIKNGFRQVKPVGNKGTQGNTDLSNAHGAQAPSIPPLICHLQSSRIVMGIDLPGNLDSTEFALMALEAVILINADGSLSYGQNALNLMETLGNRFSGFSWELGDLFRHNDSFWCKRICIDGKNCYITPEFLLGYLLKILKTFQECKLGGGPCDTAILAIPYSLTSTERIRVKNAAEIAGFVKVHLVNEGSAAAYNFVVGPVGEMRQDGQGEVLVISNKVDCVAAFVYSYNSQEKKLRMVAHSSHYKSKNTFFGWLDDSVSSFIDYMLFGSSSQGQTELGKMEDTNWDICKLVLEKAKKELNRQNLKLFETLIISEIGSKWDPRLSAVVRNFGRKPCDINEATAVLSGLKMFQANPEMIGDVLQEKIALDVVRFTYGGGSKLICKGDELPAKIKRYSGRMSAGCNRTKFYQRFLGRDHLIGELRVKSVRYNECLEPQLNITNEGVVTLDSVLIQSRHGRNKSFLADEQIQWKTPNMTEEGIQEQRDLLTTVFKVPSFL